MPYRRTLTRVMVIAMFAVFLAGIVRGRQDEPVLTWTHCPEMFDVFYKRYEVEISCFRLSVHEDRSEPSGNLVDLFVAVVGAPDDGELPPLLYVAGGPGDAASSEIAAWLTAGLNQQQTVIFVDQRGSGLSEPSLDCPELNRSSEDARRSQCHDRLLSLGIDLAAYNLESLAQDVADLINALQLDNISLYAVSYGSRIALQVAGLVPERIQALVLDSPYLPGDGALESAAANLAGALSRLFNDCGADPDCASAYPRLASQFEIAVAKLTETPITIEGLRPNVDLLLDGASFLGLLRDMLADSSWLPYIPALIYSIVEGDDATLSKLRILHDESQGDGDGHSEGLYMSVFCASETTATTAVRVGSAAEYLPATFAPVVRSSLDLLADCANWIRDRSSRERGTETFPGTPTLWLRGRYDPVTPQNSSFAGVSPGWRYTDPRAGHGVLLQSECARLIMLAFLAAPSAEPRHGCQSEPQPLEFYTWQDE